MFNILVAVDSKWGIGHPISDRTDLHVSTRQVGHPISDRTGIPWAKTPAGRQDLAQFKDLTMGDTVIMGRNTWKSIPITTTQVPNKDNIFFAQQITCKLPGRRCIIVSSKRDPEEVSRISSTENPETDPVFVRSFGDALAAAKGTIWVIGGAQLYAEALKHPNLSRVVCAHIPDPVNHSSLSGYGCSLFFNMPSDMVQCGVTPMKHLTYRVYQKQTTEEQYLRILSKTLESPVRDNRTAVKSKGYFYDNISVNLTNAAGELILPLLTTKKVLWRSIYHELIWFLRGSTDTKYLQENDVHIWDGNSSSEYLASRASELRSDATSSLNYEAGQVGPIYGAQWRSWGGDQLQKIIKGIIDRPTDRRHVVSAWNVDELDKMALPPCHYSFQFHVEPPIEDQMRLRVSHRDDVEPPIEDNSTETPMQLETDSEILGIQSSRSSINTSSSDGQSCGTLNCIMNMRSCDVFCGLPFNLVSYALLTHMVAKICRLKAGKLVISICDVHIYMNEAITQAQKQLTRSPRAFPTLLMPDADDIDEYAYKYKFEDYTVVGYEPAGFLKCSMVV